MSLELESESALGVDSRLEHLLSKRIAKILLWESYQGAIKDYVALIFYMYCLQDRLAVNKLSKGIVYYKKVCICFIDRICYHCALY